ncbi:MAG: thiopurine S-methyltransferase [Gammaproteobacteria bacterium]|jgi:thiopurine S-methyltransferase|nr:thiopurine S-methyltransferase [Gammaproteobacteria bacterium]MBT4076080.1 thiopurine S-methyltransferase [Gammaproteobacteria bacterium]MBT4448904.1 thiopurine S-methyltransferase [Gammaproteobacteria bacterium]MBT4863134.1 thiopurine S-methyltransferase [Gammaproteobacteria bacterium]MBT6551623.1 thiopurine S-methyltransferase [Gammaproteobacteria bacterium]
MKQTVDWHSHWIRKSPGFHEGQVNSYLQQFLPLYNLQPGDTVFMPLCGKAVDILWLSQQGYHVIGVELSDVAIQSFFEESGIGFEKEELEKLVVYKAENITLYQGDYMNLQDKYLKNCKLVYDRASIVAIESFNRKTYKRKMLEIIPAATPMLLVTLDYDQNIMQGPPFSVPVSEITQLYQPEYKLELLQSSEQIEERPKWRDIGLQSLLESALRLSPNEI